MSGLAKHVDAKSCTPESGQQNHTLCFIYSLFNMQPIGENRIARWIPPLALKREVPGMTPQMTIKGFNLEN